MNIKKYLVVAGVSAVTLVSAFSLAFADSQATFTFTNNTGKPVNDLHLEFNTAVQVATVTGVNVDDNNTNKPTLRFAPIARAGTIVVSVTGQANKTKIKKWYWTIDGKQEGPTHKNCKAPNCTSP